MEGLIFGLRTRDLRSSGAGREESREVSGDLQKIMWVVVLGLCRRKGKAVVGGGRSGGGPDGRADMRGRVAPKLHLLYHLAA
jgi:hypothetical protein